MLEIVKRHIETKLNKESDSPSVGRERPSSTLRVRRHTSSGLDRSLKNRSLDHSINNSKLREDSGTERGQEIPRLPPRLLTHTGGRDKGFIERVSKR